MNRYIIKEETLISIANAIREATGSTGPINPSDMALKINKMENGGASAPPFGEKLYSFGVLSDIHVRVAGHESNLNAFKNSIAMFENLGAEMILISGDIADTSTTSELERYRAAVNEHPNIAIHTCAGNHDKQVIDEVWETHVGTERNYVFTRNNDVFIMLSIDYGADSSYGEATTEWLKNQLIFYKGARIFVFMHYPPSGYSGLLEGQYYGFNSSSTEDDVIMRLFNNTRHITAFHGHTHYSFDVQDSYDEMNIFRFNAKDVNLIHVPSSAYCRGKDFESNDKHEGWLVDVYKKGIVLNAYDLVTEAPLGIEYVLTTDHVETLNQNAIVVSETDLTANAGESIFVNVNLLKPENTVVNITTNNSFITITPTSLTFTEDNYNVPQSVQLTVAAEGITQTTNALITYSEEGSANQTTSVTIYSLVPILAHDDTWYKSTTPRSSITSISLVNSASEVPSTYSESWSASESGNDTVTAYIDGTDLYIAGNGSGEIKGATSMEATFSDSANENYFSNVSVINGLNLLNTTGCTSMEDMFRGCSSLSSLNLNSFDTSLVRNMNGVFLGCTSLTSLNIDNLDVHNVKYAYYMFADCENLTSLDLSNWTTTNFREIGGMFSSCYELTNLNLNGWDTSNISYFNELFSRCTKLTSLDLSSFNTSSAIDMSYMFYHCDALNSLNISHFVTSQVNDMTGMFKYCGVITSLELNNFDTSNVNNMSAMFSDCLALQSLNISSFNTSKVTNMSEMFDHCDSLTTLNISSFDTSAITGSAESEGLYRFARKSGITNLVVGPNFIQDYNLPDASANNLFLYVTSTTTPLTITGANNIFKTYNFAADKRTVTFTN